MKPNQLELPCISPEQFEFEDFERRVAIYEERERDSILFQQLELFNDT